MVGEVDFIIAGDGGAFDFCAGLEVASPEDFSGLGLDAGEVFLLSLTVEDVEVAFVK